MQAWAIVDNTSGEDWQNVQLGGVEVGALVSASISPAQCGVVQRETLRQDDLFAQAPPTGGAAYNQLVNNPAAAAPGQPAKRFVLDVSDEALAADATKQETQSEARRFAFKGDAAPVPPPPPPPRSGVIVTSKSRGDSGGGAHAAVKAPVQSPATPQAGQLEITARTMQASNKSFVIEGYADHKDADKYAASLERANRAREQLVRSGVDPSRVVAVGSGEKAGRNGGVTIVEASTAAKDADGKPEVQVQAPAQAQGTDPIGTSHFESKARMTVPRGTSAMVSILSTDTGGEVVYFFDAETPRGNATYPFRAVKVINPTDSVLEQGPVTVFGEGKFIGEGMCEPIPARSTAFIPFALDRQIVVERKDADVDRIARVITVQRGVFSTEVQHTRRATFVLNNRLGERATVYVRHTVADGYKLTKAPEQRERLGAAHRFRVDVEPGGKAEITIEESTPRLKSTDIRSPRGWRW